MQHLWSTAAEQLPFPVPRHMQESQNLRHNITTAIGVREKVPNIIVEYCKYHRYLQFLAIDQQENIHQRFEDSMICGIS
jgi:hypothetical protein